MIQKNNPEKRNNKVFTLAASNPVDWSIWLDDNIQYIPQVINARNIKKNKPHPIKNHLAVIVEPLFTCCFLRVLDFLGFLFSNGSFATIAFHEN